MQRALTLLLLAVGAILSTSVAAEPQELVPSEELKLGAEVLAWGKEHDVPTLAHKGRVVVRGTKPYSPFSVLDRWDDSQTHAVLLQAGVTATLDCALIHVLESRTPDTVVAHDLGLICVGMRGPTVERTDQGFIFSPAPLPTMPAEARHWLARTGTVVTTTVEWHPAAGTTMAAFVERPVGDFAEPLETAEFFAAVSRLPKPEQNRVVSALWDVANGCPLCGGSAVKERYGVAIDARTAAFSGCGWYMYGTWLECGPSDALAVWDRTTGAFYFATDVHQRDGVHLGMQTLAVTPPLEQWSTGAKERFEIWRNGWPWPSIR
jgi:hypothetical protein